MEEWLRRDLSQIDVGNEDSYLDLAGNLHQHVSKAELDEVDEANRLLRERRELARLRERYPPKKQEEILARILREERGDAATPDLSSSDVQDVDSDSESFGARIDAFLEEIDNPPPAVSESDGLDPFPHGSDSDSDSDFVPEEPDDF